MSKRWLAVHHAEEYNKNDGWKPSAELRDVEPPTDMQPFPEKLPARLMKLYSYGAAEGFPGEIVVDPFVGTGTTCVVAEKMQRRWIGIDINPGYLRYARRT